MMNSKAIYLFINPEGRGRILGVIEVKVLRVSSMLFTVTSTNGEKVVRNWFVM
jgi:hypothetical protein